MVAGTVSEPAPQPSGIPLHQDDTQAVPVLVALQAARAEGDEATVAAAWATIASAEIERIRGLVAGFRDGRLPGGRFAADDDVEQVVEDALARTRARIEQLHGYGVGEVRALVRAATAHACIQRAAGVAPPGSEVSASSLDAIVAPYASAEFAEFAGAMVHPALAEVDDDTRAVLVMIQAGSSVAQMAERLGITPDDVYARRRRGLRQLHEAARELSDEQLEDW